MASLKQFEAALKDKNVVIERIKFQKKEVYKAYGSIDKMKYYWLGSGVCYSISGSRKPLLDINLKP